MFTLKSLTIAATLASVLAAPAMAGNRDIQKHGKFFQNVKAEHVAPLFSGAVYVSHIDYDGIGKKRAGGELAIIWFKGGISHLCIGFPSFGTPYVHSSQPYKGAVIQNNKMAVQYPLVEYSKENSEKGYDLFRYDGATGEVTNYWFQKNRWWEMRTGHLQSELPAVTWDLCPAFPSAKSLGARVNKKQTAPFYNDLIAQDPGKRVLKPQYEAKEETAVWFDYEGNVQTRKSKN